MNTQEIPVLLLTGYLGSGKTTLLNKILSNRKGIRFAVIVNDIGEVNIDASLIQKGGIVSEQDDSLVALQNGCICCTLKTDLVKQLNDLASSRQFDYIVIEASGICEPAPIAQTICAIPQLSPMQEVVPVLDCIVSVVDALRLKDEFQSGHSLMNPLLKEDDIENLVIQQIEFCNIILLNKSSEVDAAERKRIRQVIRAIQPKAEIIECDWCDVDFDKILGTGMFSFDDVAGSAAWIQAVEGRDEHFEDDDDDDDDEVISSYVIEINSDYRDQGTVCDAVGIDEAIAWAKEKFQKYSNTTSEEDLRQQQDYEQQSVETDHGGD